MYFSFFSPLLHALQIFRNNLFQNVIKRSIGAVICVRSGGLIDSLLTFDCYWHGLDFTAEYAVQISLLKVAKHRHAAGEESYVPDVGEGDR